MRTFTFTSEFDVPAEQLYAWHTQEDAFEKLIPPWQKIRLVKRLGKLEDGAVLKMDLVLGPLSIRWVAGHEDVQPGRSFVDWQKSGPFAAWRHTHLCEPIDDKRSKLIDSIEYSLPAGWLTEPLLGWFADRELTRLFRFRHRRIAQDLNRDPFDPPAITYPATLIAYPWRFLERIVCPREWCFARELEAAFRGERDIATLDPTHLETPRGFAWEAQLLILKAARSYSPGMPVEEWGISAEAIGWLKQAEELVTGAIDRRPSYGALTLRGHLRLLLSMCIEANDDFKQAGRLREAKKIEEGRRLIRHGLRSLHAEKWTRAYTQFRKAAARIGVERGPAALVDIAMRFEKIDEVIRLCHKTGIVTIGRSRVRYHERLVSLCSDIREQLNSSWIDETALEQIGAALKKVRAKVESALEAELAHHLPGGEYQGRLKKARQELSL